MMKKTILTLLITLCPILAFASDYIYLGSSDVNNIYVNKVAYYYGNGASYYGNLKNKYAISDEIILNYTDEKRDFLLNRNVELP